MTGLVMQNIIIPLSVTEDIIHHFGSSHKLGDPIFGSLS